MDAFPLPFNYDPIRLTHDANRLEDLARLPQPGPHHNGEWTGVAIHSAGGVQSTAPIFPSLVPYEFTQEAEEAPYLKSILLSLPFPLQVVRVLWLPPGGAIAPHVDFDTNFQFGLIRLHIPLKTNPDIEFLISGKQYDMRVGELWYGDFSKPHQVTNRGSQMRLHAVIDVEITDELLALMPPEYLAEQAKAGPFSKHLPALHATDDLWSFECRFFVPGTVLPLLVLGRLADMISGASAKVLLAGNELVLLLNEKPLQARSRLRRAVLVSRPPAGLLPSPSAVEQLSENSSARRSRSSGGLDLRQGWCCSRESDSGAANRFRSPITSEQLHAPCGYEEKTLQDQDERRTHLRSSQPVGGAPRSPTFASDSPGQSLPRDLWQGEPPPEGGLDTIPRSHPNNLP